VQALFKLSVNSLVSFWRSVLLSNTLQSEKGRYHVTKPSLLMRSSYPPISERKMGDFLELLRHLCAARLIYVTSCLQLFKPIFFSGTTYACVYVQIEKNTINSTTKEYVNHSFKEHTYIYIYIYISYISSTFSPLL